MNMGLSAAQIQKASELRRSLLTAAAQIILRRGIQALTLDAVAQEAGTSKGGLLHHFGSKSELLDALMGDLLERFEADLARFAQADPDPDGRHTRAYINASVNSPSEQNRIGIAIVTALLFESALIQRWQEVVNRWIERDTAEADSVHARILRIAADGLWVSEAFGLCPMDPELRAATVQRLLDMTRPPP